MTRMGPDGEQGQEGGGAAGARAEALADLDAREAVFALDGDLAEGEMPVEAPWEPPGPVAEAYYWDDSPIVAICGPVGSGKTTTKLRRALRRAIMMPRSTLDGVRHYTRYSVRENYRQLWSSVIPSYLQTYPRALGDWAGGRGAPVRHSILFDDGHGAIAWTAIFMAFGDDVGHAMRGTEMTDLDIAEADTNPVETLTFGAGRINRWPARKHFAGYPTALRSWGQIDCDQNAPDEDNWTHRMFFDPAGRAQFEAALAPMAREAGMDAVRIGFHRQPGYGEPGMENLKNLPPGYYELQIEANRLAGRSDVTERMVHNRPTFLRVGDPVFRREFNPRIHVAAGTLPLIPGLPLRVGLDQGFKGAAVLAQFKPPMHWRILAELHFPDERLLAAEFGRRLADLLETPRFRDRAVEAGWGDMAGEHGASQAADENATWNRIVGQAAGFRIRPQKIGTNRLQPRLEAVRAALEFIEGGEPGLLIDPGCKYLRRGFEARYVWTDEVDASGDKRKVPDKRQTEANVMDGLEYLLLSEHGANGLSRLGATRARAGLPGVAQDGAARSASPGPDWGRPEAAAGLTAAYDVLNPYGD